MPATINRITITQIGTHKVSQVKRAPIEAEARYSISSLKFKTNTPTSISDIIIMIPVSQRNIEKIFLSLAPLHLCTPIALARRASEEIEIST